MTGIGEIIAAAAGKLFNVFKLGAATVVSRVLGAFGLTLVSFNTIVPDLKAFLVQYTTSLPPKALQMMGALGLDAFMTMIISALSIRMAWSVFVVPKSVANSLPGGGQ